jgi:predicted transcriptional regulator of viral defense system
MKNSLSEKELRFISELELERKYFFTIDDIIGFFKSREELRVYIHRLRKKGRIIKLNKKKFYLIPIRAVGNNWSEHAFIIIDEMMNGRDYAVVGAAAANYWGLSEQMPFAYDVWNTKRHGQISIMGTEIRFRKHKKKELPKAVEQEISGHKFRIVAKEEAKKWIPNV